MAWTLSISDRARKDLKKLDRKVAAQIVRVLTDRVATQHNPREAGKPLTGEWKGLWRFRVGSYRVICDLQDEKMVILALAVGHRKEIYD